MRLRGKSAIVTGASRGLGKAISVRLAQEGANLALAAREADPLEALSAELAGTESEPRPRAVCCPTDVTDASQVQRLVERTLATFGRIDILVCSAGVYGPIGLADEVDWSEWVQAVGINLFGTVLCCRAVLPSMRRQGSGKIVVLSGGGATQPLPRFSAYAASKAAVVRFIETLAVEVRDTGISVNAVAPGALNTRLLDQVLAAGPERVGTDFYNRSLRQKKDGGVSLEVGAELVAFLASEESDGITGRLLSAVWDPWRDLPKQRERLADSDVFTLRRISPEDRGWSSS